MAKKIVKLERFASDVILKKDGFIPLDELKVMLEDKKLHVIAEKTGLSFPTLRKMVKGKSTKYTYDTLLRITKYFYPDFEDSKVEKPSQV